MIRLYGLASCDSCRKARKTLEANGQSFEFHDLRADGLKRPTLERWAAALGWEALLNRRSTTWRMLSDTDKADLNAEKALNLLLAHPTLVKRPVVELYKMVSIGLPKGL